MVQISQKDEDELREIFRIVDLDGSDDIDIYELEQLLNTLGVLATQAELEQMMKEADTAGTGTISFEEFKTVCTSTSATGGFKNSMKEVLSAFQVFEEPDDYRNTIKTKNLEKALDTYGNETLTQEVIEDLLSIVDPEKIGRVNYDAFVRQMMS